MVEKRLCVDSLRFNYQGVLDLQDFLTSVKGWFIKRGFNVRDTKNYEQVFEKSKQLEFEFEPWKDVFEDIKVVMRVHIIITGMRDVVVSRENKRITMKSAKMLVDIDSTLETNYIYKWYGKAYMFFLRTIIDMYVRKGPTDRYEIVAIEEADRFYQWLNAHTNLYRYNDEPVEEPVQEVIEKASS